MKPVTVLQTHLLSSQACSQPGYFCLIKQQQLPTATSCTSSPTLSLSPPTLFPSHSPVSAVAPLLRIWMARRMSRLKRATAAARSHSCSCSRVRRKISTSRSLPRLIQPQSRRARQRSSLTYRSTSVCRSEALQHRRLSVVPKIQHHTARKKKPIDCFCHF